jgi:hypothetical protein
VAPLTYATLPYAGVQYPGLAYNTLPLAYNSLPLAYSWNAPAVAVAPKIQQEIQVVKPVFKTVVQKVPVGPSCANEFGLPVPCAIN